MEEFLQCQICCINYDTVERVPRQLPCQHNLCQICLPFMKKTSNTREYLECPMCREQFDKKLSDIPKSLIIIQLIEATKDLKPNNSQSDTNKQSTISSDGNQGQSSTWDLNTYLRNIFNRIDGNNDGSINAKELQEMLRNSQSGLDFNLKTVELLMSYNDKNGDSEISFEEFYNLFKSLNDELENFLLMDSDGSGVIDLNEFTTALKNKGFNLTDEFFQYIMDKLNEKTGRSGILFDDYIRVAARFDYLCKCYKRIPYYQRTHLEEYLRKTFFQDFW